MTYKKVMASSLGVVAALSVFAVVGVSPIFAAADDTGTTTVNVMITGECEINTGTLPGNIDITGLSASVQSGETAGTTPMQITCNNPAGWELTEEMNASEDQILNIGGVAAQPDSVGFGPWSSGSTVAAFAANTWGAKYSGTTVISTGGAGTIANFTTYHAVPANGSGEVLATSAGPTVNSAITQTFGARTDGSLGAGTYTGVVLYSLTGL